MTRSVAIFCVLAASCAALTLAAAQPAVSGQTVDEADKPIRKAALTLLPLGTTPNGDPLAPYGVFSDADGGFGFYGVPDGRYRVMAERAGYLKTYYGARNTWAAGSIITLRGGAPVAGLAIRMTTQAVISGTVTSDDGPCYPAMVTVYQSRYQDGRQQWVSTDSVMADPDGSFSFNKLAADRYRLAAQAMYLPPQAVPGSVQGMYALTYYPGVLDAGAAETVELRHGQTVADLRLPVLMAQVFSVSGSITSKPSGSARLMVVLTVAGSTQIAKSAAVTGDQFRMEGVPPGSYALGVLVMEQTGIRLAALQPNVQVAASDITRLSLDLGPATGVHGTAEGAPAGAKLRVTLTPEGTGISYRAQADVGPDGTFFLQGSYNGRFRIRVDGLPPDVYIKSAVYAKKDVLGGLDLAQANPEGKLEIALGAGAARIAGVVADARGNPLDAFVTLIPDPPQPQQTTLYQLAETDENGRFEFQSLRPGKYLLYACEEFEAGSQFDPAVTEPLRSLAMPVELTEGDRKAVNIGRISVDDVAAANEHR